MTPRRLYILQTPSGPAAVDRLHLSPACSSEFHFRTPARLPLRIGSLVLMVVSIGISPRIPLPIDIPGRQFDLRVEDLILVVLLFAYLVWLCVYRQIDLTPLARNVTLYCAIVVASTSLAIATRDLSLIRAMPYVFKLFEYFLIFLLVTNWVRSIGDLRAVVTAIIAVGIANMVWVAVQTVTGTYQVLFYVSAGYLPSYMFHSPYYLHYYGPALIGELAPYATGGFFTMVFLLALGFALFPVTGRWKWFFVCLCFSFAVCTFLSGSRTSAAAAIIGAAVLLLIARRAKSAAAVVLLGLIVAGALERMSQARFYDLSINDRWNAWHLEYGVRDRRDEYWKPMLELAYEHFWTGMGTGSLGFVPGTKTEAHDQYLRVFLESGIFGLAAFLWLLFEIMRRTGRTYRVSRLVICRAVSGAALATTIGLIPGSLVQDAYVTVVPNELLWVMIGLTMAAHRIERDSNVLANLSTSRVVPAKTAYSRLCRYETLG